MNRSFLLRAATGLLAGTVLTLTIHAQTPPPAPPPGVDGHPPEEHFPEPVNLKALPRSTTGKQVHEIMHEWSGGLGVRCNTCHAIDPDKKGPDGKPALNYADDSKEEKRTARVMYRMLDTINAQYISSVPNSDMPVTCGTCHRGRLDPEPYVPPAPKGGPPHGHEPPAGEKPHVH